MRKLEKEFEAETGKQALIAVVGHGEKAYASWDYQVWLENRVEELEQRLEAGQVDAVVMWRSVKDELPEEHEDVLVYFYGNKDSKHFPECRYMKQSCFYNGAFECEEEVTHWAELPEPPQAT